MRLTEDYFNGAGMTTDNSLANALMIAPEQISPALTYLTGKDDKQFPLTFLTEGTAGPTGGNSPALVRIKGDIYDYNVISRQRKVVPVAITNTTSNVGIGHQRFTITFTERWFIKGYVITGPSNVQVRIMEEPIQKGTYWEYKVQLLNPDTTATMPAADLTKGALFAQMFAPVGMEFSRGNASNWVAPSKIRHRIGLMRKSYAYSGSVKHRYMWMDYNKKPGEGANKLWLDYEEYQHMVNWKKECEMYYWYGQQTYNDKMNTHLTDDDAGNSPIIVGPGLLEQVVNKDTYTTLTADQLKSIVRATLYGMSDTANMQLTLYTGIGGADAFDTAMKDDLASKSYIKLTDNKFVFGSGRNLALGGFFTQYQHVDGYVINVVRLPVFDYGPVADVSEKHPITGLPLESHRMVFVDQSVYDGEPNVQMVTREGREMRRWAVAGAEIPRGFTGNDLRASDIDGCSVHFMKQAGIVLKRFTTSLDLQCVIS
jgi:hypothetical protein